MVIFTSTSSVPAAKTSPSHCRRLQTPKPSNVREFSAFKVDIVIGRRKLRRCLVPRGSGYNRLMLSGERRTLGVLLCHLSPGGDA